MLTPKPYLDVAQDSADQHRLANGLEGWLTGLETMSWPRLKSPQVTKSSAEHEVEMIHLILEFNASNHAQAATLTVSLE